MCINYTKVLTNIIRLFIQSTSTKEVVKHFTLLLEFKAFTMLVEFLKGFSMASSLEAKRNKYFLFQLQWDGYMLKKLRSYLKNIRFQHGKLTRLHEATRVFVGKKEGKYYFISFFVFIIIIIKVLRGHLCTQR